VGAEFETLLVVFCEARAVALFEEKPKARLRRAFASSPSVGSAVDLYASRHCFRLFRDRDG
jgi:hypothetical protein